MRLVYKKKLLEVVKNRKKANNPIDMLTRLYKHTTEKAIQMILNDTKRCSFSLIIGKKPVKNHRKNCFSPLLSVKKKKKISVSYNVGETMGE